MKSLSVLQFYFFLLLALGGSGCCTLRSPMEDSGFLPSSESLNESEENIPFDYAYVPNHERLERAKREKKSVCLQPVVTAFAEDEVKKRELPAGWTRARIKELRELGADLEAKFKEEAQNFDPIEEYEGEEFAGLLQKKSLCEYPAPDSLVWEVAIIDVSPNIPVVSVLATVANYFLHGTALVRALGAGGVVVEGILRDGETDDVLLTFRERQGDKVALFSVRNYTVYGHTRRALSEIAHQMIELSYAPQEYDVPGSWTFTFNPF
jgi:hypothetical protein